MKPADRIKQLETELKETQETLTERENLLTLQDAIIGTMLHKERAKDPQELRTLTFRERHGDLPPTTGVGATIHLKQTEAGKRGGLEDFGSILNRITNNRK